MKPLLSHILCVDDEEDILEIVKLCLEDLGGFKTSCFNDVERSLDAVEALHPDMIMLDVMMPKINGVDAIRLFKEKAGVCNTPILLMSARIQPKEVESYLAAGASGVIAKPFDPMTLVGQIRALWEKVDG